MHDIRLWEDKYHSSLVSSDVVVEMDQDLAKAARKLSTSIVPRNCCTNANIPKLLRRSDRSVGTGVLICLRVAHFGALLQYTTTRE